MTLNNLEQTRRNAEKSFILASTLFPLVDKGKCICYFEATEELYYWTYDELRAIIGK